MTTPTAHADVVRFVAAVRAELSDLSPEEIDDLTGGLEADLDDALAEGGTPPAGRFGDPVAYAAELRSAAGFPIRDAGGARRGSGGIAAIRHVMEQAAWWPPVRDFVIVLRPVWWLARAWVGYAVLQNPTIGLPDSVAGWVLLLVLIVLSVEVGRRRPEQGRRRIRLLIAALNVLAVLLFLVLGVASPGIEGAPNYVVDQGAPPSKGLSLNGHGVRNLFPYDSQGRPLHDVRLVDDEGTPVEVDDPNGMPNVDPQGRQITELSAVDVTGRPWWGVFPLRQSVTDLTGAALPTAGAPSMPSPPVVQLPPLSATPPPSPSPSSSASPSPSP